MQSEGKLNRGLLFFLLILFFLLMVVYLISPVVFKLQFGESQVDPTPIPVSGSVSENVEGIKINQLNMVPEFNFGGTLTGVIACLMALGFFVVRKKQQ
jgi:hypothetical protein